MKNSIFIITILLISLTSYCQVKITMQKEGGVYLVPCKVNGLSLKFVFDTGASDVSISVSEAVFMLKNGYLSENDIIGTSYTQIANGDIVENTKIILKEIEIGGIKIYNVTASVSHTLEAPLLLGQSAIQKLGTIHMKGNELLIYSNEAEKVASKDLTSILRRAFLEVEAGRYREGIKYYKQYTELRPNDVRVCSNISYAYLKIGDTLQGIEWAEKAFAIDPSSVNGTYNLGVILFEINEYARAERIFNMCTESTPSNDEDRYLIAVAHAYLGDIYFAQHKNSSAEKSYLKSIQLYDDYSIPYLHLGDLYIDMKMYNKSIEYYKKGLAFEPHKPANYERVFQLAVLLYAIEQDFTNAIKYSAQLNVDLKDCVVSLKECFDELGYLFIMNCNFLSEMFLQTKNYKDCISVCRYLLGANKLVKSDKKIENDVLCRLGTAYELYFINKQEALDSISKLYSEYPACKDLLFSKAFLLGELNKRDEAQKLYFELLNYEHSYNLQRSDYATVYNNIAWGYYLKGMYEKALHYAEKSINLNKQHSYSWETIGEIYYYLKRYDDCINAMTKSINIQPSSSAYKYRGLSKQVLGKNTEGKEDLENSKIF